MGAVADDMIDGCCCTLCGQYFRHPKGGIYTHCYPVVCWDCWDDLTEEEKNNNQKSDVETL